ncbi:hypothetical protein LPJ74_002833 [Coemansia sp. RSA 1843]|nr:hypothetical protein LPJ74_002833 [Coemansia sp. RSA 1843]
MNVFIDTRCFNDNADVLDTMTLESAAKGNATTRFLSWLPGDKRNSFYTIKAGPGVLCSQVLIQAELNTAKVPTIATSIKDLVSTVDRRSVGNLNHLVNSEPSARINIAIHNAKHKNKATVTSISKYGAYKLNFGTGTPTLERPVFRSFPNLIHAVLFHPDIGGYNIVMAPERDVANIVAHHKQRIHLVDSCYFDA